MKHLTKTSAVVLCAALTLASLPLPAFSAVAMRTQVNGAAAPVTAIPVNAGRSQLGSGSLLAAPQNLGLTGSLSLPRSPLVQGSRISAVAGPAVEAPVLAAPGIAVGAPQALAAPVGIPGAPGLAVPGEQAFSAPAGGAQKSLVARLGDAIRAKLNFGRVFDNSRTAAPGAVMGILPQQAPKNLPAGIILDQAPSAPDPQTVSGVAIESFEVPGARRLGGIFSAGPTVLSADPASEASVEKALRDMVDADPVRYGVASSDLKTIHVRRVPGVGQQADTVYAYFRQQQNGIEMHGSYLSFTIKVLKGKAVVMGAMGKLYPGTPVDTTPRFPDDQLQDKAMERLGPMAQAYGIELEFIEKKIIYSQNAWHASNLYKVVGFPVMIAVDMVTGEAFAWDPRAGTMADEAAAQASAGRIFGHTTDKGPTRPSSSLVDRPMPDLTVSLGNGKTVHTDENGNFSVPEALAARGAAYSATLSGKWAQVTNNAGQTLRVGGTLNPDGETTVVFNPDGMTEEAIAQVNGYLLTTLVHDWAKSHGLNDARLDQAIPVNVNIDDECNAYYTPYAPSLNFFKSSENCVNSSYDTVVMHEYGHFIDDMLGGIVNGGLSEGWGDIFSMYILNNPIIGEGFLKKPRDGVDYIRHGDNTYQYSEYDEVHDQGQAWGGFAWKLRKALMAKLGEAAGAAVAEALVVPTMLAKAADIPSAMAQVLLSDMDQNGVMPHEAEIRGAAAAHGVALPQRPGLASMLRRAAARVSAGILGAGARMATRPTNPGSWRSLAADDAALSRHAKLLMVLDQDVFAIMMDAAKKGVLATVLAAAAYVLHPILTAGVGLVALAQYYRMFKFMSLHNKLQKVIQEALLSIRR